MQKVCYFLKAKGVPLDYAFEMYHYGPYSQELYFRLEELVADGIIEDMSSTPKKSVIESKKDKFAPGLHRWGRVYRIACGRGVPGGRA